MSKDVAHEIAPEVLDKLDGDAQHWLREGANGTLPIVVTLERPAGPALAQKLAALGVDATELSVITARVDRAALLALGALPEVVEITADTKPFQMAAVDPTKGD